MKVDKKFIAYLHNTPVEKLKQTVAKIDGQIEELKIDAKNSTDRGEVAELYEEIKERRALYRAIRGYYDVLYFAYEYFSDNRNPENETNLIPEGVTIDDAPEFHEELCEKLDEVVHRPTKKIGWAAPRGHAKSAYLTNIFPIHEVVYQNRRYIIIVSETASMSQTFIEYLKNTLKHNPKIVQDFGEVLSVNARLNEADNTEVFITHTDIKVQATSIGSQLRGSRFRNARPDLIILDDVESSKNTNTQDLREKNLHWFNSVIEPIGDPDRTAFIYMGTLVHGQGLLPNILSRPEYDSKIYSSILEEPERTDLWDKLQDMLSNPENPIRLEDAEEFYEINRAEMDKGIKVLWETRFSYLDLMKKKVDVGTRAFASEYLNKPSDEESAIFVEEYLEDNTYKLSDVMPNNRVRGDLDVFGFWDIAMGKNKRSDYNAIVIIAKDRRTGVVYVLEAWAEKCRPHKAIEKSLELIRKYRPRTFGVETINAQYEFYRQIQKRANIEGIYGTRIKDVNPTANKEQRIEALEPLFEQGYIKILKTQRLLRDMLLQYPQHQHDDLPDALAGALELSRFRTKRAYYKPEGY